MDDRRTKRGAAKHPWCGDRSEAQNRNRLRQIPERCSHIRISRNFLDRSLLRELGTTWHQLSGFVKAATFRLTTRHAKMRDVTQRAVPPSIKVITTTSQSGRCL